MEINKIFATRRKALEALVKETTSGNVAEFARLYGLDATYIRQLINEDRTFGEKSARNLEESCGLVDFYFDLPLYVEDIPEYRQLSDSQKEALRRIAKEMLGARP